MIIIESVLKIFGWDHGLCIALSIFIVRWWLKVQTLHTSSANNYKLLVYRTSRNFEHTQTKVFYLHYRTVLQYKCWPERHITKTKKSIVFWFPLLSADHHSRASVQWNQTQLQFHHLSMNTSRQCVIREWGRKTYSTSTQRLRQENNTISISTFLCQTCPMSG